MGRHWIRCLTREWLALLALSTIITSPSWAEPHLPQHDRAAPEDEPAPQNREPVAADKDEQAIGRELFTYEWQPLDPRSAQGDGLGPVYNARSCAACHKQGGIGGSSGNEQNVLVLTRLNPHSGGFAVSFPTRQGSHMEVFPSSGVFFNIFNGPFPKISTVLHRFGTSSKYEPWRADLVHDVGLRPPAGTEFPRNASLRYGTQADGWYFLSQRSAPALFGAGQIDQIAAESLHNLAAQQANDHDGITGRVPIVGQDVGRFGWRGQIATLHDFVKSACANELGLQVTGHPQASDPSEPQLMHQGIDLSERQVDALTLFVSSLPSPSTPQPPSKLEAEGQQVFRKIGCATCHVEDAHQIVGIYSDLLLHEMGSRFADAPTESAVHPFFGAMERNVKNQGQVTMPNFMQIPASPADYLGAVQNFGGAATFSNVWRTPPLWGVADSAPYLHDGRAPTLATAIAMHGGEANHVAMRYRRLPAASKRSLITFLEGLHAPNVPQSD